ncbi:hypothetical protein [Alsobacter sp. R-9]
MTGAPLARQRRAALLPGAQGQLAVTLIAGLCAAAPALAEPIALRCTPLDPTPGNPASLAEGVFLDTEQERIEIASPGDGKGGAKTWAFRNAPTLGDRIAFVRDGHLVAAAALRSVPHAFTFDLRTGAFTWSSAEPKGPWSFRFTCRRAS